MSDELNRFGSRHFIDPEDTAFERHPTQTRLPRIVSLFSGPGGLDLGFRNAGFDIAVALDFSAAAISTHRKNFPQSTAIVADLAELGSLGVLKIVSQYLAYGERIAVIGGPPCQGFSRANSASRADDPRNKLPKLYLDIVRLLQKHYVVEFIVLENVLGIKDQKHALTYHAIVDDVRKLGFDLTTDEFCALDFGVAQNRKRIVMIGMRSGQGHEAVQPQKQSGDLTVRGVIGGLCEPAFFRRGLTRDQIPLHPNHWTMMPKSARFKNPEKNCHPGRSFRKLNWDKPSPTIAFGHREIHVHPDGRRRLSIYEAMLLQGFPTDFILTGNLSAQVEQVSNAVPPPLAESIALAVKKALAH